MVEFVSTVETTKPLTQKLLDQHLPQVLEHFKKQGKSLELAILNQPIKVKENEMILEVMGHVQEERAHSMRQELMTLIRNLTGAGKFQLSLEVKEEIETAKNKLYTSSDKFNYWVRGSLAFYPGRQFIGFLFFFFFFSSLLGLKLFYHLKTKDGFNYSNIEQIF